MITYVFWQSHMKREAKFDTLDEALNAATMDFVYGEADGYAIIGDDGIEVMDERTLKQEVIKRNRESNKP